MFIMCDDFPSVVLYLDNKSKETSSLSTPNDNDPVFCVYELRFTLKKNRICKEIFFGEGAFSFIILMALKDRLRYRNSGKQMP